MSNKHRTQTYDPEKHFIRFLVSKK